MNNKSISLSKYRLEKSKEDLLSAKLNLDNNLIKASINRSYYSIFHGVRAVNALDGFDSKRHSGVISHFNKTYIHGGVFDKETYSIISKAFRVREKSDYDDFYLVTKSQAMEQYEEAEDFFKIIEGYLRLIYEGAKE